MRHRRVDGLMSRRVVSVHRGTPFKDVVRTLAENRVPAVPVVDDGGRVLGVVSEADLLRKTTDRADPAELPSVPGPEAWERARAEGVRAEELMSAPAVCARPGWTFVEAARLMEVQDVQRLVVVDEEDRVVGVVSRGDLLKVFLRADEDIRREIEEEVLAGTLRLDPGPISVGVRDGQVELGGTLPFRGMLPALEHMCGAVDGVVSVSAHLSYAVDDTPGEQASS
ncbi:CBS domain-containing protein [Streptomyces sp. NPDC006296]|uniref:CBS domain-containing protein n=1 Tax=Streptomyces sp. NPDC006296 TaxID=3156746 RepID=UPI0033B8F494